MKIKTEKICPRCNRNLSVNNFVDSSGLTNPKGKYCSSCYIEQEEDRILKAIAAESENITKLKIIYGKYWKHYALPHDFKITLYLERDYCPYCGVNLGEHYSYNGKSSRYETNNHIDHMDPLDLGGEDSIRNALVCCALCNNKKWKKSFLYWLEQLSPRYKKLARYI